jgi:hypothetical protein
MFGKKASQTHLSACVCSTLFVFLAGSLTTSLFAQTRATSHALLIGIATYAPPKGTPLPNEGTGHSIDSRFAPNATWHSLQGPPTDVAAMHALLEHTYGFTDIRELHDQDATRQGILDALNKLIDDTQKGDHVVVYYSGHGSQRLDTKSSKNQRDQTIVPVDAWKGVKDIRDKELALLFDKIVFDKQARLTAIYDSCNSGTMARGITQSVQRTLPYDDDDVAKEPGAVMESDLMKPGEAHSAAGRRHHPGGRGADAIGGGGNLSRGWTGARGVYAGADSRAQREQAGAERGRCGVCCCEYDACRSAGFSAALCGRARA